MLKDMITKNAAIMTKTDTAIMVVETATKTAEVVQDTAVETAAETHQEAIAADIANQYGINPDRNVGIFLFI